MLLVLAGTQHEAFGLPMTATELRQRMTPFSPFISDALNDALNGQINQVNDAGGNASSVVFQQKVLPQVRVGSQERIVDGAVIVVKTAPNTLRFDFRNADPINDVFAF